LTRRHEPATKQAGGDAGVAFVIGEDPIAEIVATTSSTPLPSRGTLCGEKSPNEL
jgi:hypothetical protein